MIINQHNTTNTSVGSGSSDLPNPLSTTVLYCTFHSSPLHSVPPDQNTFHHTKPVLSCPVRSRTGTGTCHGTALVDLLKMFLAAAGRAGSLISSFVTERLSCLGSQLRSRGGPACAPCFCLCFSSCPYDVSSCPFPLRHQQRVGCESRKQT